MCGRYTLHQSAKEIAKRFGVDPRAAVIGPRYNIAPSQIVPVIRQLKEREMIGCKWGLIPFWAKDPAIGNKLINAKAETLAEKPSFKQALSQRRCLIPANGFYEWQKKGKAPSQPMYVRRRDGGLFAFAGLWEEWKAPDGERLQTCTIITTEPNELISQFHHRMAVVLKPDEEAAWLELKMKPADVLPLLKPYDLDDMEAFPVARAVNSPAFEDVSCIAPLSS
ncbi:MAG: SOS response-associated peptidase [Acidobacteriota bacterium]|nr:SOS response-associated peptidase [Acidobacteriota bacterium]